MKILFVCALLANIIFFLWEYNSPSTRKSSDPVRVESDEPKQILLKREVSNHSVRDNVVLDDNRLSLKTILIPPIKKKTVANQLELVKAKQQPDLVNNKKLNKVKPVKLVTKTAVTIEEKLNLEKNKKNKYLIEQVVKSCYQVGPFKDAEELEKWRQLNSINIESLKPVEKETSDVSNYLVYYPAESSFSESQNNIKIFEKLGIKDHWIFREGKLKGAISLGLFNKIEPANLLQENMAKFNVDVEIMARFNKQTRLFGNVFTYQPDFKEMVIMFDNQSVMLCKKIINK